MTDQLPAFKAYDVRGKIPEELNEELVYKIGLSYANLVKPSGKIVTGRDIRDSSPQLQRALNDGLCAGGVNVVDAGLCGTETIYYGSSQEGISGGLMVTASHNPKGYNGIKPVLHGGRPLLGENGLVALKQKIMDGDLKESSNKGSIEQRDFSEGYNQKILSIVTPDEIPELTVVANPGNGCAGPTAQKLFSKLNLNVVWVNEQPDETFPNGIPNPLLPENRKSTQDAVINSGADMGIAWDGDFDRCFFFDHEGSFIEGYYLVGVLAQSALAANPGASIIHDPRLYWNTIDVVEKSGGKAIMSKTGHAFIKESMRKEDAVYGGEMSAHHYFKDFSYCDSGMIPWLLLLRNMKKQKLSLKEMVEERQNLYPCSGEINFKVEDAPKIIDRICNHYRPKSSLEDATDGISFEFNKDWRFNLRSSNTEPLLRLNVESSNDNDLMVEKTAEIEDMIKT